MLLFVPLSFEETTLFRDKRVPTVKGKERPSPHELNPLSNRSWRMFSVEPPALGAFSSADNASRSDIEPYGRRHTGGAPSRALRFCFGFGSDRESKHRRSENRSLNEVSSGDRVEG